MTKSPSARRTSRRLFTSAFVNAQSGRPVPTRPAPLGGEGGKCGFNKGVTRTLGGGRGEARKKEGRRRMEKRKGGGGGGRGRWRRRRIEKGRRKRGGLVRKRKPVSGEEEKKNFSNAVQRRRKEGSLIVRPTLFWLSFQAFPAFFFCPQNISFFQTYHTTCPKLKKTCLALLLPPSHLGPPLVIKPSSFPLSSLCSLPPTRTHYRTHPSSPPSVSHAHTHVCGGTYVW